MAYTQKELEEMAKAQSSSYSRGTTGTTSSGLKGVPVYANSVVPTSVRSDFLTSKSGNTKLASSGKGYSSAKKSKTQQKKMQDTTVLTSTPVNSYAKTSGAQQKKEQAAKDAATSSVGVLAGTLMTDNFANAVEAASTGKPATENVVTSTPAVPVTETAPAETEETTSSYEVTTPSGDGFGGYTEAETPTFQVSDAYLQAMEYTNSLLSQMSSGRTSYTDQIEALLKEYQNRDAFSYDAATDPMFQQMLAGYTNSGKMAMQDTIGQAAALTGGYGNTYGTAAGNAAYNQYLSEAYGNLPEYYNLALQAYDMEGQQMLNELGLLNDADQREYDRLANAYQANLGAAESLYDKEYTQYLNDLEQSNYENEFAYQQYMDALNQQNYLNEFAYQQSQDALAQQNYLNEFAYQQSQDALAQKNYENEIAYEQYLNSLTGGSSSSKSSSLSNTDISNIQEVYAKNGGGDTGEEAVANYLEAIGKSEGDAEYHESIDAILASVSVPTQYQEWNIADDTKNGGFLWFGKGVDHNDTYTNGSETMTYDELAEIIENSDMSAEEKRVFLDNLKSQSKR